MRSGTFNPMRAGYAERDITPPPGTALSGFVGRGLQPYAEVRDPLSVRALTLEGQDGKRFALVSFDLLLLADSQVESVRSVLAPTVSPELLLLTQTHTHSGPAVAMLGEELPPDALYEDRLVAAAREVVEEAVESTWSCRARLGRVEAPVGVNRHPGLTPNPAGPYDPTLTVLRLDDEADQLRFVWFSLPMHPTILQDFRVSGDWPGVTSNALSKELACPTIFSQGCAGDVMPREQRVGDEAVEEVGAEVASHVLRALEAARPIELESIDGARRNIVLASEVPAHDVERLQSPRFRSCASAS